MEHVLITGANGFVGAYLVTELLAKNYFVIATGKGESRLPVQSNNFKYESLDFTNAEEVAVLFKKYKPSIVVHSGAMSKPDECELNREAAFRTNVSGTMNLLSNAEMLKCSFIFLSTDFVFSGTKDIYREDDTDTFPVNYYGETKFLAEQQVRKYQYDWAIIRTVLVYGQPSQNRQNILTNTANALRRREPLRIFNDQVRTPTYVKDLAKAIAIIAKKSARGIFHISGKDILTPYQIALAVADHLGLDASLISKVTWNDFQQPARRPAKTIFDITKAKTELGYEPVSFKEGLERTFANDMDEYTGHT